MDRREYNIYVAVENTPLRSLLTDRLRRAGYAPKVIEPDEILLMEPNFGPNCATHLFIVWNLSIETNFKESVNKILRTITFDTGEDADDFDIITDNLPG